MDYDSVFETLFVVGAKYGVRPDVPIESEEWFRNLVSRYSGPEEAFSIWLDKELAALFRCVLKSPEWLQSPEWPIFQERPMMFIGQIDYPRGSNQVFDHDASYYVFLDYETGTTKTIVQVV